MALLNYTDVKTALDAAIAETGGKYQPFDLAYYSNPFNNGNVNVDVRDAQGNVVSPALTRYSGDALQHYVEFGAAQGFEPNAWFDPIFYRQKYPDAQQLSGADLLVHFSKFGANEGRAPSAVLEGFSGTRYLADNPDVAAYVNANLAQFGGSVTNGAIAHFVKFGALEARQAFDVSGNLLPFTVYPATSPITPSAVDAATDSITVALNSNNGNTVLTGAGVVAQGADVLRLTGTADIRIDFTNTNNQVRGIDLDGDGTIESNGVENNVSGAGVFTAKGFTMVDAYSRNPFSTLDAANNFQGNIRYDGTGYYGDGVSTDGNIFLGGMGSDVAYGGIGNDFLAGGSTGGDFLDGGRNADFFFREISPLDVTDNPSIRGGETTDDSAAGLARNLSGWNSQNNDWVLFEASDDNEGQVYNNFAGEEIESFDASGDLYGFLDGFAVEIGGRSYDLRSKPADLTSVNYGIGSTAQLDITGDVANNVIIGGYDNDAIDGGAGNDILFGGKLEFLLANKNNPNLLNATGGLKLNTNVVGVDTDGADEILGNTGNDHIVFEMDGGSIDGEGDTGTTSGDTAKVTGDTLWATDFAMGRLTGAMQADEATAQAAALAAQTTDNKVRFDLGNTATVDGIVEFRNYGGSNAETADQTNYEAGVEAVALQGMESVIATGLGAIDFDADGTNASELASGITDQKTFTNQQNFGGLNADMDLRGSDVDNTLYANTGEDTLEGRAGDDNLSGGTGDDTFVLTYGDNVDTIHRQKDADGDNLWDGYKASSGKGDFVQDFRAPQVADISASHLVIDFGATDLTSPNVAVTSFFLKIGGTNFNVTDGAALAGAKSAVALAAVVNAAYQAIDPDVSVVASGNTIIISDAEGRDISDTPAEGYAVALTLAGGIVASANPTFTPGGTPINEVENDILVIRTYDDRTINLGQNETTNEIQNANALVARFDTTGTQLAEGQQTLIKLVDINEGDKITVTINGKQYSYTAIAGDDSESAGAALVTAINDELDLNSGSGEVSASNNAEVAEFDEANTTAAIQDVLVDVAVIGLAQNVIANSQTFMNVSVDITNALTGKASGSATLHNQSNTYVDLVGFDGRDNNLNGDDVLFLGRSANSVSLLETADNAGDTITGKDATDDQDNTLAWINGDDLLIGGNGNDTINGGTGDDNILVSKGTDTVNGGGNVTEGTTTVAFTDVLQAEEYIFGTNSRFKVTLDANLGAAGRGTGVLLAQDSTNATVGTTNFSGIENVRLLENSRESTLDVAALSNSVATAVGANAIIGTEGLTVNLTRTTPAVTYTIDGNNAGGITAGLGLFEAATGDYNAYAATQVYGAEHVVAGNANDTVNIDESQLTANNKIDLGNQQDNTTTFAEGEDTVAYDHSSGLLSAAQTPVMTLKVEAAGGVDEVTMTGGILATPTKDVLTGVEVIDVTSDGATKATDTLDVSALNGAVIMFSEFNSIDVKKSLGGDNTTASVANTEADTLEVGGIALNGSGLGNEKLEVNGITEFEKIVGSAGNDVVAMSDAFTQTNSSNVGATAVGRATVLGAATALSVNNKLYSFDLAAGDDTMDYFFGSADSVYVSVDTTAADNDLAIFSEDQDFDNNDGNDEDRIDSVMSAERYYGVNDTADNNVIDLVGATVATTIQFSKESDDNSNEVDDYKGDAADGTVDLVRGTEVRDTVNNTVFARFMDRTGTNTNGTAYWGVVAGSATLAENVILTDNETDVVHLFDLGGGANVVDYSARTAPISAAILNVDQANNEQSVAADGDTITVAYASYAAGEKTLTVIGSDENGDIVDISDLDVGSGSAAIDSYNLVDLQSGVVVEDVLNATAADEQGKVIYITGFENITGSDSIDRLFGDGSTNGIAGGLGNDWIIGRGGRGTLGGGPDGDVLTGGAGADRFIFETELDSATDYTGAYTDEGQDTVTDFTLAQDDALVFNTTDAGVVKLGANVVAVTDGGAGFGFQVEIDQNGDGDLLDAGDDDYTIIDTTGAMAAANIIIRVAQTSGQDFEYLSNVVGAADGQFEIVYTAASQSNNLALPDELHELDLDTLGAGIGNGADKIDLRSFDFGAITSGDSANGNGGVGDTDRDDNGVADLVEEVLYSSPVTVNSLVSVSNFFREGALATGVAHSVHVQLEPGSDNGATDGYDFRVFVDINKDGNYTQADDLVFDLVDVLDAGADFNGVVPDATDFQDDVAANGAGSGIFVFTDAQYNLWF